MKVRFKPATIGIFNTQDADKPLEAFTKGARLIGLTNGKFSLIDLIHSTLKKTGPARVICATWSAGIKDAHQLRWMIEKDLLQSFTLVIDSSYGTRKPKDAVSLTELFGAENIRTSNIHAKFCLIYNAAFTVTIRTSMNLTKNRTCESFEIDDDPDIFGFYMGFITHTFADMQPGLVECRHTVNQSLSKFFNNAKPKPKHWSES